MSAIYPPTETNIRGTTPDGRVVVQRKNHEMPVRFAGLVEVSKKKGNKQQEREKSKVDSYNPDMMETTNAVIGSSPADDLSSTFTYENPRSLWTPKERKQWRNFIQLWKKHECEIIPVLKQELKEKLLNKYGTIHPDQFEKNLNIQMQHDPRLDIKVRRGIVKTSVNAQHARNASSSEGEKR